MAFNPDFPYDEVIKSSASLSCSADKTTLVYDIHTTTKNDFLVAYVGNTGIDNNSTPIQINDWVKASASLVTTTVGTSSTSFMRFTIEVDYNQSSNSRSVTFPLRVSDIDVMNADAPTILHEHTISLTQEGLVGTLRFNIKHADLTGNNWIACREGATIALPFIARGNVGEIRASGGSDYADVDIVNSKVVVTVKKAVPETGFAFHISLSCEAGGFVYDPNRPELFDQVLVSTPTKSDLQGYNDVYRLSTWQHSAGSAYVVKSWRGSHLIDVEMPMRFVFFEFWDESSQSLVGEVIWQEMDGDIREFNMFSVNDVLYLTHENMHPKKIERFEDDSYPSGFRFEVSPVPIKIDPVLNEYADRNVFSVEQGTFNEGDEVRVTELELTEQQVKAGAFEMFGADDKWRAGEKYLVKDGGQMLMLKHPTEMMTTWGLLYTTETEKSGDVIDSTENLNSGAIYQNPRPATVISNKNGGLDWNSGWIFVYGKISIETSGKWSGRLVVDLWKPGMALNGLGEPISPEELAVLEVNNAAHNRSVSRDIYTLGARIRIRCVKRERARTVTVTTKGDNLDIIYRKVDNDTGCYITLSNAQEIPVYLRIKEIVKRQNENGFAICEALHPFEGGFDSSSFAEGAWSLKRYGYPRCCGIFQERLVFGGNKVNPCTLWCSKTGDWTNFIQGSDSTSPIFATANTDNIDAIQWMQVTKSYIQFGSLSGEWYFGASDSGALKPTNYAFQRLSNFGSTQGVPAVLFGNSTIVAKNGGRQIVDVSYNSLSESGNGVDLSLLASHLFEDERVVGMAATLSPSSNLWVLGDKGSVFGFTYEPNNNVFAWTRHKFLDGVKAMTAFRRGERDVLALIVNDGGTNMLCEFDPFRGDDYVRGSDEPIYGTQVFLDERSDGSFSRYESRIIPTPIVFADGVSYGRKTACKALDIYLRTHNGDFDGSVSADGTEFCVKLGDGKEFVCNNGWLVSNELREFGENRVELPASGGWEDKALVDIHTDYPAPFTITALGADFGIGG